MTTKLWLRRMRLESWVSCKSTRKSKFVVFSLIIWLRIQKCIWTLFCYIFSGKKVLKESSCWVIWQIFFWSLCHTGRSMQSSINCWRVLKKPRWAKMEKQAVSGGTLQRRTRNKLKWSWLFMNFTQNKKSNWSITLIRLWIWYSALWCLLFYHLNYRFMWPQYSCLRARNVFSDLPMQFLRRVKKLWLG